MVSNSRFLHLEPYKEYLFLKYCFNLSTKFVLQLIVSYFSFRHTPSIAPSIPAIANKAPLEGMVPLKQTKTSCCLLLSKYITCKHLDAFPPPPNFEGMCKYVWSGLKSGSWKMCGIYFGGASGSTPHGGTPVHGKVSSLEKPLWFLIYMLWHPWKKRKISNVSPKLEASKADALDRLAVELLRAWAAPPCEAGALSVWQWMVPCDSPNWCWNGWEQLVTSPFSQQSRLPFPSASSAWSCSPKQG